MRALWGVRVLIVDDDADGAEMLAELLTARGAIVQTASSGPEALAIASRFVPDAFLLDIEMPHMDGYELARRLRMVPATAGAYTVAVTAHAAATDVDAALAAGFDAHVAKPIDGDALVVLLAAMVGRPSRGTVAASR